MTYCSPACQMVPVFVERVAKLNATGSDWIAVYRVTIKNLCAHDEPGALAIAKDCIESEGLFGVADMDDFELVSLEPMR